MLAPTSPLLPGLKIPFRGSTKIRGVKQQGLPCQRRVEKSAFLHDKGLRPGGYPEAALPSSSFTATLSMPALRLVLGHQKVGGNCGIVQLMA